MTLTREQLEARRNIIGASEAAAVLGMSPFASASQVYYEKTTDAEPRRATEAMESGSRLEPVIIDWCAERLGKKVYRNDQFHIDPLSGVLGATPDAFVFGNTEIIEAKRTSLTASWGEEGTDQIPDHYLIQTHIQMEVLNRMGLKIEIAWVPVLMLTAYREEWRVYKVDRNPELGGTIAGKLIDWHSRHLAARVPPDDVPPTEDLLKRLRRKSGATVVLGHNGIEAWERLEVAKARTKAAQEAEAAEKTAVLAMLGLNDPAEYGQLPDGRCITYLSQKSAPSVDHERFRAEHPDLYATYIKQGTHRTLRIRKA